MIVYDGGYFGFRVLLRLHGSAVFKALLPASLSTIAYAILFEFTAIHDEDERLFEHPYPMAALLVAFSFLLTFKMSFAYNRYWEAVSAVHQMHSKWLDTGMELAAFHLQSKSYTQPPTFGAHPEITQLVRERERIHEPTMEEMENKINQLTHDNSLRSRFQLFRRNSRRRRANSANSSSGSDETVEQSRPADGIREFQRGENDTVQQKSVKFTPDTIMDHQRSQPDHTSGHIQVLPEGKQPSLFLQESAHLLSLLSAVAMSTLRNDLENAESPLGVFVPGQPWPHVDPDAYGADVRTGWGSKHRTYTVIRYLLGMTRDDKSRTLYNAARPFRVVGGVSDAEIRMLQAARGPLAKVALCTLWWQEFISREYLAGSTGKVAPPIISRLYQFTSDGMVGYNQARKIAYIPFPFPHAQITSLYILVLIVLVPTLMLSYVSNEGYGIMLNFFTVLCFAGFHEVSRELENPFINIPNDIPLNNFHAQFNEALMTTYSGYHPDSFWTIEGEKVVPQIDSEAEAAAPGELSGK